eukprot:gene26228-5513_t
MRACVLIPAAAEGATGCVQVAGADAAALAAGGRGAG